MNKKVGIIVGVAIAAILVGSIAFSKINGNKGTVTNEKEVITVTDRNGEVEVPKNPKVVVSLDYGSTDVLDKLGVEVAALPKKSLPSYLDKYKDDKYKDLGDLFEFSAETINELKPDLIIIEGRQQERFEELSKIAPTIYLGLDGTDHFGSLERNIDVLGKIFDKEDVANKELDTLKSRINAISEKVKADNLNALVTMVNEGSMSVYGNGSRFNSIYNEFGFKATDENIEVSKHGQSISSEYLVEKNPNYLFVLDKNVITGNESQTAKDIVENELVKTTDTYKDGHIVYLNPQAWYIGGAGLQATEIMIDDIEKAII